MISKKTKYALKALIYLAREYDKGPILIADLARDEMIPKKFLELILLSLKNNGLLLSKKGKGGGYYLGRPPRKVSMGQIIRIMEGPLAPVPCVSASAYEKCDECENEDACGIKMVMKDVRDAMSQILDHTTLADVLEKIERAQQQGREVLNFVI
ncbi:MAG TPA: Rrf2 family transcriptional regulator [Geobacteraceae bacterium]